MSGLNELQLGLMCLIKMSLMCVLNKPFRHLRFLS